MIVSFRHKGLEELFKKGKTKKISTEQWPRIIAMLDALDEFSCAEEIFAFPQWKPHKLTGYNPKGQSVDGHWSLKVTANWRLTYYFDENGNVVLTDYIDYH